MIPELETNAIDRAVANLMFNEMDLNLQHFPLQASVHSKQEMVEATGPVNYSLNQSKIQGFSHHPVFPADALVPVFGEEYP
uniref:Uncharacterized protein n=1 Tax=Rhizophora mucronata TaxID=61149 RepID=A0A2P2MQ52_RHIMU